MDNQLEDLCTRTLMELSDHLSESPAHMTEPTQSEPAFEDSNRDFGGWDGTFETPGNPRTRQSPKIGSGKTQEEKSGVMRNAAAPLKQKVTKSARLIVSQTHKSAVDGNLKTELRFRQLSTGNQGIYEGHGRRKELSAQHSTPHIKQPVEGSTQRIVTSSSFLQLPNLSIETRKDRKRGSLYAERDDFLKAHRKPPVPKSFLRRKSTIGELQITPGNKAIYTPRNALSPLPLSSARTGIALSDLGNHRLSMKHGPQGAYTLAPLNLTFDPFAH